jgi:hypothetical protein
MTDDFITRISAILGDGYVVERERGAGMSRFGPVREVALGRRVVVKVLRRVGGGRKRGSVQARRDAHPACSIRTSCPCWRQRKQRTERSATQCHSVRVVFFATASTRVFRHWMTPALAARCRLGTRLPECARRGAPRHEAGQCPAVERLRFGCGPPKSIEPIANRVVVATLRDATVRSELRRLARAHMKRRCQSRCDGARGIACWYEQRRTAGIDNTVRADVVVNGAVSPIGTDGVLLRVGPHLRRGRRPEARTA